MSSCLMEAREALDLTMRMFDIKASDLAVESGVDPVMISRYRNKKRDMHSLNVFEVIKALPDEAQKLFLNLVLSDSASAPAILFDGSTKYTVSPKSTAKVRAKHG